MTALGADGTAKVLVVPDRVLAETDTYWVKAHVPQASVGADGTVTIQLTPKEGWKINQEFPTKLKVGPIEGVTLASDTMGATDAALFSEKSAIFEVKFNAADAGAKAFSADFRFAVCTDATCDPKKAELAWNLDVK